MKKKAIVDKSTITNATKWSAIINIMRKLISPITNMILARLLVPEIFGVVATINIVISFADIFTDAGLQKYLIQHEFKTEEDLFKAADVSFWTNLFLSIIIWIIIFLFRNGIAGLVGSDGYGVHLSIAALSIPLLSFSSIQQSIFKRNFDFKRLFIPSLVNSLIPLIITIPIAYFYRNCWALIIGTLAGNLSDAVLLTIKSRWKPRLHYKFKVFKEMFAFSAWTLLEKISIWLTLNMDTFILGKLISKYYLGLYKTSLNTVNQILNLITVIIIPVLFSTLSRLQNDDFAFKKEFNRFQKKTAILLVPMSFGLLIYKDVVTWILLGNNWMEASLFIGLNGFIQFLIVLIANFASEVYRSKGNPKLSFLIQIIYVAIFTPVLYYYSSYSFNTLCIAKIVCSCIFILIHLLTLKIKYGFDIITHFSNMKYPIIASIIMSCYGLLVLNTINNMYLKLGSVIICIFLYFELCSIFKDTKKEMKSIIKGLISKDK